MFFFWITFLLVRKHWTHTHNFDSSVDLIKNCGGKEGHHHQVKAPKKVNCMSPFL